MNGSCVILKIGKRYDHDDVGAHDALWQEEKGRPEGLLKHGRHVAGPGHTRRLPLHGWVSKLVKETDCKSATSETLLVQIQPCPPTYADLKQNGYCSGPENRCPQGHGGVESSSRRQLHSPVAICRCIHGGRMEPEQNTAGCFQDAGARTGADFRTATWSVARAGKGPDC